MYSWFPFISRLIHCILQGLAVTGDVLLVLGILGAIFDAIVGAAMRSKLRDSINKVSELC